MKALQITIEEVRVTAAMNDNWWHNRYYSLYFAPYYIRSFGDYYGSYQNADSQYTDDATVEHYAIFDAGDTPTFENDLPLTWSYCLPFDQTYFSGESEIKLRVQLYRFNSNAYCYIDVPIGVSETYDTTYTAYLNWAYYGGLMEVDYKVSLI
jgi:hypothetical protein